MGTIAEKLGRQLSEAKAGRRATPVSNLRRRGRARYAVSADRARRLIARWLPDYVHKGLEI